MHILTDGDKIELSYHVQLNVDVSNVAKVCKMSMTFSRKVANHKLKDGKKEREKIT